MSSKKFYPQTEIWFRQAVYDNMRNYGAALNEDRKDATARQMFLLMVEEGLRGSDLTVTELAEWSSVSEARIRAIFKEYDTSVRKIRGEF
jgi:hypothetical protein